MTLIRQYVDALLDQDALALSKLFSPTAIFVDHCPRDAGKPLVSTYGPEAIDMFYHNRFLFPTSESPMPVSSATRRPTTMPSMTAIMSALWPPSRNSAPTA